MIEKNNSVTNHLFLIILTMLYITFMYSSAVLTSKIILFGNSVTLAGVFMVPLIFCISDIVAEVYGYKTAKILVIIAFCCQLVFAGICAIFINLPSPDYWHGNQAYHFVLGPLMRIGVASFFAYMISSMLNIYIISRWKILWRGRFFWLRSIGSSTIGELIFTVLAVVLIQYGKIPYHAMLQIMITSYAVKILASIISAIPATIAVIFMKRRLQKNPEWREKERLSLIYYN